MTAFPELRNLSSDRERAIRNIQIQRAVEPGRSDVILRFWEDVGERLDKEDDLDAMSRLVAELERDISLLQAVKETQSSAKDDPMQSAQHSMAARMLQMLIELLFQYKKRLAELKEQAWRYYLMLNPAIPSKVRDQMERDKEKAKGNKKPAGQAKAEKALNETPPPKKDAKKKDEGKVREQRPEKKMSP